MNNLTIKVRDASESDLDAIVRGNARMAEETESKTLDSGVLRDGVARILADRRLGRYWVATSGDQVIGQIMVTYEWSDWRNTNLWWIQSVYVDATHRRAGAFRALYAHVQQLAQADTDCGGLRLYVETSNERAQQVYEALGMTKTGYQVMETLFAP